MRGEMMEMSQKMMDVVDVRIEGMEDMLQHLQTTVHQLDSKVSSHSVTSQCRSGATVLKVGGGQILRAPPTFWPVGETKYCVDTKSA